MLGKGGPIASIKIDRSPAKYPQRNLKRDEKEGKGKKEGFRQTRRRLRPRKKEGRAKYQGGTEVCERVWTISVSLP